ncbi:MAG TPA: WYL domain-containing protein [Deinococcales bacterium]|nr:WYL domain-containing protein [Deinococcales bacterium]
MIGPEDQRAVGRAERLLKVMEALEAQPHTTTTLLARLELAPNQRRSLQRDLELLLSTNRIDRTDDGRYTRKPRGPMSFNEVEAVAVYSAVRLLFHHASEYNPHYKTALEKLGKYLPERIKALALATNESYQNRKQQRTNRQPIPSEQVGLAWLNNRWLRFNYSANNNRPNRAVELAVYLIEINPQNRAAYAIGLDRTGRKPGVRVFKIARMRNATLLDETYQVPKDFNPLQYLSTAWGIMPGDPQEIELHFTPNVANRVLEETWPQTQSCEKLPDGSVRLVLSVGGPIELTPWILGWGAEVTVQHPESLRQQIAQTLTAAAANYTQPAPNLPDGEARTHGPATGLPGGPANR